MGYWDETYDGRPPAPSGSDLTWGDRPADIMDEALDRIIEVFERDLGRRPSENEVRAGLEFALPGRGGQTFPATRLFISDRMSYETVWASEEGPSIEEGRITAETAKPTKVEEVSGGAYDGMYLVTAECPCCGNKVAHYMSYDEYGPRHKVADCGNGCRGGYYMVRPRL